MNSLWFCVPTHGRLSLTQICLRQLRRTCDSLTENGIHATAVVIGDDENLATARALGFGTIRRSNDALSAKFNDGFQLAFDPELNPRPADFVVPCGSDDWVDYRILLDLLDPDSIIGFQYASFVREDGDEMTAKHLNYPGGCGIRIYPRQVTERLGYRPADEDRSRGCDTSTLVNIRAALPDIRLVHPVIDPRSIVDWKSPGEQLNRYDDLARHRTLHTSDPFDALTDIYPADALEEMQAHYAERLVPA